MLPNAPPTPWPHQQQQTNNVDSLGCISILILAVQVWCEMHAKGQIAGALTRDTHNVVDIFFFVFGFYSFRRRSKVIASTQNVLDTWSRSLLLWFTRLADRVTLSMYLNSDVSRDTAAPAQRGSGRRNDDAKRTQVRMTVQAKWNAIVESREKGLSVGGFLQAHRNPAVPSPYGYGAGRQASELWMKKLNKMYIEAANVLLAHGVRIWSWWTQESYSNALMHVAEYTKLSIRNSEALRNLGT